MKRILILLIIFCLSCAALAGCGGKQSAEKTNGGDSGIEANLQDLNIQSGTDGEEDAPIAYTDQKSGASFLYPSFFNKTEYNGYITFFSTMQSETSVSIRTRTAGSGLQACASSFINEQKDIMTNFTMVLEQNITQGEVAGLLYTCQASSADVNSKIYIFITVKESTAFILICKAPEKTFKDANEDFMFIIKSVTYGAPVGGEPAANVN